MAKRFRTGLGNVLDKIIANEAAFTKMDGDVGDGDMGIGATRGAKAVKAALNNFNFKDDLHSSIISFSDLFSDGFGGTSGPLWGAFMSQGATKLKTQLGDNSWAEWAAAYEEGLTAMKNIGEAQKGDRTMVDALEAGLEYIKGASPMNLADLAKATRAGADHAKTLQASKGRSAYLGDKVVGLAEPGCELAAHIF